MWYNYIGEIECQNFCQLLCASEFLLGAQRLMKSTPEVFALSYFPCSLPLSLALSKWNYATPSLSHGLPALALAAREKERVCICE